jgi:hypothetical protein
VLKNIDDTKINNMPTGNKATRASVKLREVNMIVDKNDFQKFSIHTILQLRYIYISNIFITLT